MQATEIRLDPVKDRYRTCCDICHIKFGTAILGAAEAIVCVTVLISAIQQIVWKNSGSHNCSNQVLQDCLIFHFSHFDVTLILDYIVIAIICLMLLSICLLFYGILTDTSCLLLPHILIQAILLLFSVGYFCFYAVSYFYGDLYKQSRPFKSIQFIERMWLATLLLALAAFQTYLFSSVIRCSMYISGIEEERRRRGSAFDRCSERVRLAKEKGVYSAPTLDATVQKKPEDGGESTVTLQKLPKKVAHVQWSTQNPSLAQVDETTTTPRSLEWATGKPITQSESVDESRGQSPSRPSQQRRRSDTSRKNRTPSGASTQPLTSQTSMQTPIPLSEMPSTSRAVPSERRSSRSDRRESSSPSPTRLTSEKTGRRTRYSEPNANLATRKRNPRPPLQKFKSYEADDPNASPTSAIPPLLSQESARRTSLSSDDRGVPRTNRRTDSTQSTGRPYSHIKKVSITAIQL